MQKDASQDTIRILPAKEWPDALREIPDTPKKLYIRGILPPESHVYLAVVGSRSVTSYGKAACERLIAGLAGYPIVIVSGLAIGMDTVAHRAALAAQLPTVAIPGSGLDTKSLYPTANCKLAEEILEKGGALVSEFEPSTRGALWTFPRRNRIMAGISRAVLVIEAADKSGTLITARLALDYNRDVLAVPGSIFSDQSAGTNKLVQGGAIVALTSHDILRALGFKVEKEMKTSSETYGDASEEEIEVLKLLSEPISRDDLIRMIDRQTHEVQTTLSMMELKGYLKEDGGLLYRI